MFLKHIMLKELPGSLRVWADLQGKEIWGISFTISLNNLFFYLLEILTFVNCIGKEISELGYL